MSFQGSNSSNSGSSPSNSPGSLIPTPPSFTSGSDSSNSSPPLNSFSRNQGPTYEQLEKDNLLHPWSQTQTQRKDLAEELDMISEQYLQCENDAHCDDQELKELYVEGVMLTAALTKPKQHWDYHQCRSKPNQNSRQCIHLFEDMYNAHYHIFDKKLTRRSKVLRGRSTTSLTPKW